MKLVTFLHNGQMSIGAVRDNDVVDLSAVAPDMISLIELGAEGLAQARERVEAAATVLSLTATRNALSRCKAQAI